MFHPASSILTAFRPVQHLRHMLQPVDCRQAPPAWRGGPWRWSARRRAQCFSPGGVQTVSPGRTGPPEICTRPTPETTLASGRSDGYARCAPGSNVTSAVASRAGDPVRGHPARRRRPGCEHRDLILTGEYVRSSRGGGGQISGVLSPRTGGPGSYAKVWNSIRKAHPRRRPCAFVYVCFRGNSGHRISSGRTFPLASSERCRSASLRSFLLICAFSTACMCRVSTQITGNSASARALNSHCDNGPASSPIRLKW